MEILFQLSDAIWREQPLRIDPQVEPPRYIVEELLPYSQPERTAANLPMPLDDAEAVWLVTSGGVDVFFTGAPHPATKHKQTQ